MAHSAMDAETLLKALANRHRLMLVCQLSERPQSVGELANALGLRDSTVSQHLALLRKDGLVSARRDGQTVWYTISSLPARKLVETLYRIFCAPASACKAAPAGTRTPTRKRGAKSPVAKKAVKSAVKRARNSAGKGDGI